MDLWVTEDADGNCEAPDSNSGKSKDLIQARADVVSYLLTYSLS